MYKITIQANWNNNLVMYAHGYEFPDSTFITGHSREEGFPWPLLNTILSTITEPFLKLRHHVLNLPYLESVGYAFAD